MPLEIPKIDFKPYASLLKRIAVTEVWAVIMGHDGEVAWQDPELDQEWEKSLLLVARRTILTEAVQENWQRSLPGNYTLIGVPLAESAAKPLGWLLVLINSVDSELCKNDSPDQALVDIAGLLLKDIKASFERVEMIANLVSHDEELDFIHGSDGYMDGQDSIARGMENIVRKCCHHMNMDAAAILVPSQDIWTCHFEEVADPQPGWEVKLREFSAEVFSQFMATGHNMQVNQVLLEEEKVVGQTYVLVSPIKSRHGHTVGLLILFKRTGKEGFSKSEEKVAEVMAIRISKYMVAGHDPLTGLFDRLGFEAHVEEVLGRLNGEKGPHTIVKIDIDSFELVNDAYSVIGGDLVLKQLAVLIKEHLRSDAVVARIGGDVFGVILPEMAQEESFAVIERLREKITQKYFEYDQRLISITVSIGLITLNDAEQSLVEVESALDVSCKNAKENGGNRVQIYEVGNVELTQRLGEISFANKIDAGLEEERFELYCQPLVPLWGANFHYEVLLRLKKEGGGVYMPDVFMGAAERYNRLPSIDRWVVKAVFKTLSKWEKVLADQYICWGINLTGQSLAEESFMQFVEEQIRAITFPSKWVYFEITESVAIRNIDQVRDFVSRIKALGCNFALDDFGTGYSSYEYLKNLPASYLKIDGSFIRDLNKDPFNQLTVQSINQLAHYLGLQTVAEYVETEEIGEMIRKIGIDYAQGYAYGLPQPIEQVLASLAGQ